MLVSGVQQHDLVINIYVYNYILFFCLLLFRYSLLQDIRNPYVIQ